MTEQEAKVQKLSADNSRLRGLRDALHNDKNALRAKDLELTATVTGLTEMNELHKVRKNQIRFPFS